MSAADPLYASARGVVAGWEPRTDAETATRDAFLAALAAGPAVLRRDGPPSHLTASAFVFDTRRSHVLLCFHRKGLFWVQPGGHLEAGDRSIEGAALRELLEETGLGPEVLRDVRIADLDHHALGSGFGRCASHLDIGVAGIADRSVADAELVVSDESEAVAWWPIGALPPDAAPRLADRIDAVLVRLG